MVAFGGGEVARRKFRHGAVRGGDVDRAAVFEHLVDVDVSQIRDVLRIGVVLVARIARKPLVG